MATDTASTDEWQIDALGAAVQRISVLTRAGDLAEPVSHLNRWKIRDVVAHLGGVHRWATRILTERSMAGPGSTKSKLDGDELCDWFDEGADNLLALFRSQSLDDPCPNFNPGSEGTVGWWARRQAHESTVLRWDIEHALGCNTEIAPNVATDGIDEFLDVFVRTRGKQTLASTLVLRTEAPDRSWLLTPADRPGRIDVAVEDTAKDAAAEVIGRPEGLLLALWGRHSAADARLRIVGEPEVAASLLTL